MVISFDSGSGSGGTANQAPVWSGVPGTLSVSRPASGVSTLDVRPYASDPDGDALVFSLQAGTLPGGVTFADGVFTVAVGATIGSTTYTVRCSDGSLFADQSVTIQVNDVSSAPAYVPNTAFQALALTSVVNGNVTGDASSIVTDWDSRTSPQPSTTGIVERRKAIAFSGGVGDSTRGLLHAHGGGHGDSSYNGILTYDVNGTTQPQGWTEAAGSASDMSVVPASPSTALTMPDGRPTATHTYDTLLMDEGRNRMYRASGSIWSQGTQSSRDWYFDFGAGAWAGNDNRAVNFAFGADLATVYSPAADKALLIRAGQSTFRDLSNDTYSSNKGGPNFGFHYHGAFDPTRNRGLFLGNGSSGTAKGYTTSLDWTAETATWGTFTTSGDDAIFDQQSFSIFYDPTMDRFWMFGGRTAAVDTLYWFDAGDLDDGAITIFSQSITGSISQSAGALYFGMVQRFLFMDNWRALYVATTLQDPVHVIKLP